MRSLVFVVASALAACGPSAAEIRTAKTATYAAPAEEMYRIAVATASETYKIGEEDREHLRFATRPQWYNPEGGRQSEGAGGYVQVIDRSVELTMVVEVVVVGPNAHAVNVTPVTFQHLSGSPQPRELKPDDPNLPPWIHGRVESLQLAIHNNAKQYAAK
jgi:hypothetical protein